MTKLTRERAYEVLHLDVETGVLTWRIATGSRSKVGQRAGYVHEASGYRYIKVEGGVYREHVLIWFMLYGEWAPRQIDHADLNRSNNCPSNLRKATESEQRSNTRTRSDNALGIRGVSFHKALGYYVAEVRLNGKRQYCGYFHNVQEAAEAARVERLRVFGQFAPSADQTGGP